MRTYLKLAFAGAFGMVIGAKLDDLDLFDIARSYLYRSEASTLANAWRARVHQPDDSDVSADCPKADAVFLVLGQSSAANFGGHRFEASGSVFEWYAGRCYRASGPLVGSEGIGGNPWPLVGDRLIEAKAATAVLFVGAAIGGTVAAQWQLAAQSGGYLDDKLLEMKAAGIVPTHVLWYQGESDKTTEPAAYVEAVKTVFSTVRHYAPASKIYVGRTSRCFGKVFPAIVAAQTSLVNPSARIYAGPDTDLIDGEVMRFDRCHFSGRGIELLAAAWTRSLIEPAGE